MESLMKVKTENYLYEEKEVRLALIGGYDMTDTNDNDLLDLNLKVEKLKIEDMVSCEENGKNYDDLNYITKNNEISSSCSELGSVQSDLHERENSECNLGNKSFSVSHRSQKTKCMPIGDRSSEYEACNKSFGYQSKLLLHTRTHIGVKPFKCKEYNDPYSVRSRLLMHRPMRTHTRVKPFKCIKCSKTFAQFSNLNRHMSTHTGDKPFKCIEYSKSIATSSYLSHLMHTHTGDKPFKCKQ